MKLIVLDFLHRWRWVLIAYAFISGLFSLFLPVSLAPFVLLMLNMDSQRGVIHAVRPQPVSLRNQERAWWFIAVWLLTLISAAVMILATLLRPWVLQWTKIPELSSPWFACIAPLYLGLGLCAFIFMVPAQRPQTKAGWIYTVPMSALAGLMIPGSLFFMMRLPRSMDQMERWHWGIAGLILVLAVTSYIVSSAVTQKRLRPFNASCAASGPTPQDHASPHKGSTGLSLLLLTLHSRILSILFLMGGAMFVLSFWAPKTNTYFFRQAVLQTTAMSLIFCSFMPDWFSLRMLRSVPLSVGRLTLILLSLPLVLGVVLALPLVHGGLQSGYLPLWVDCLAMGLFVAGSGAALITFSCHVSSAWRFAACLFPMLLMPLELLENPHMHGWLLVLGTLLFIASALLLRRGFWRSSAFYRPRYNFGMNTGQDLGRP